MKAEAEENKGEGGVPQGRHHTQSSQNYQPSQFNLV